MSELTLPPPDAGDVRAIAAELILVVSVIVTLVVRCVTDRVQRYAGAIAGLAGLAAFLLTAWELVVLHHTLPAASEIASQGRYDRVLFDGHLLHSPLTLLFRLLVLLSFWLTAALCSLTGLPKAKQAVDFWTLMTGATVGMLLTVTASSVLMMFVGIEMMSVPGYVLAAYFKGRAEATESSLKYVVYGAGASGLMLYGLSVLVGLSGELELAPLLDRTASLLEVGPSGSGIESVFVLTALLMVTVGLAFKLSAAPFHFWCPDVFTGAPAEVGGFLSVASKLATLGLALRLSLMAEGRAAAAFAAAFAVYSLLSVIYGNLAAYSQINAKRLMAYSTIAQAGYLCLGVAAAAFLPREQRPAAAAAAIYYAFAYVFMNMTVFAGIAALRNATGGVQLGDYRLLARRTGSTTIVIGGIAAACFSLVGLPPFAGFFGKLLVFASAFEAAQQSTLMATTLAASMLMSIVSLGYYLKLIAPMVFSPAIEAGLRIRVRPELSLFVAMLAASLFLMLIPLAGPLLELAQRIAATAV